MRIVLVIFMLIVSISYAGEEIKLKSSKAIKAIELFKKSEMKAQKVLEKTLHRARKSLVSELEPALKDAMKKGDLDDANLIKRKLDEVTSKMILSNPTKVLPMKLVLWNLDGDHGVKSMDLYLMRGKKSVWSKKRIIVPHDVGKITEFSIDLPNKKFTSIKIKVESWYGPRAGLAEIQMFRGSDKNKNYALDYVATSKDKSSHHLCVADNVNDGVIHGGLQDIWTLNNGRKGELIMTLKK